MESLLSLNQKEDQGVADLFGGQIIEIQKTTRDEFESRVRKGDFAILRT